MLKTTMTLRFFEWKFENFFDDVTSGVWISKNRKYLSDQTKDSFFLQKELRSQNYLTEKRILISSNLRNKERMEQRKEFPSPKINFKGLLEWNFEGKRVCGST